jgi:hypothetical protein
MFWSRRKEATAKPQGKAITVQQGVAANALTIQAIINILVRKQVCTREELLAELKNIAQSDQARVKAQE